MTETFAAAGANGSEPGHDTGYSFAPGERTREPQAAPSLAALRDEIRALLAGSPPFEPDDGSLLELMGRHDAALGAALLKLPEREGAGGAAVALLARKYRGAIDLYQAVRIAAATLIFWPDPVPQDEQVEDAALRLADFSLDAAQELARAYVYLGPRFTLKHSLRVLMEKYAIPAERFSLRSGVPAEALTPAGIETMLEQGQIDLVNDMLRPYEIAIRQKIGTVKPVYSLVEKNNGRHVMPALDLIEFLRTRAVFG
jgi:hypothetical protein